MRTTRLLGSLTVMALSAIGTACAQANAGPPSICGSPRAGEAGYHQRVSSGVMAGLIVHKVDPVYPPTPATGMVIFMACISGTGEVEKLQAISGPAPLRGAAEDAVKRWTYKPYLLNGVPTPVATTISVLFQRNP